MEYSLRYFSTSKKLNAVDELVIKYTKYTPELIEFLDNRPKGQRIVIHCFDYEITEEDVELIRQAAVRNNTNVLLELPITTSNEMLEYITTETSIHFFFDTYITSKGALFDAIKKGVSDVKLMGSICFSMKTVANYCHERDVRVRVCPNLAQSDGWEPNGIIDFFIRPEDIEYYEDLIDICEFYGPLDKQDVLYDIYKDERWLGYLDELIIGFTEEERVNNLNLLPNFYEPRLNCNRRCVIDEKCNYCQICKSMAKTLNEKDIYIAKEKKKYEYNANETVVRNVPPETI